MYLVQRFVNELMTSNCYIISDAVKSCVIIDPGSEKSLREIEYIDKNNLNPQYIILTHEHTDHNWGVNSLRDRFGGAKLVCSDICNKSMVSANRAYFLFYYDKTDYKYEIAPSDIIVTMKNSRIIWNGEIISFILTPGHSFGSMCILFEDMLFSGDTIMQCPPYFNGRDSSKEQWEQSINKLNGQYGSALTMIYPGHGDPFRFDDWKYSKRND